MSQFQFMNNMNMALRMDEPITRGPAPRWQKQKKSGLNKSETLDSSIANRSKSGCSFSKTPRRGKDACRKPPKKSGARSAPNTPGRSAVDRFIPNRSALDFEMAEYLMSRQNMQEEDTTKNQKMLKMSQAFMGCNLKNTRVLAYIKKAPAPPDGYQNAMKVVYSQSKTPGKSSLRFLPNAPERILDAPDIMDDYYLNLVDWGANNMLAVALGNSVYVWNASTGGIDQLMELEGADYVCSVNWIQEGNLIAVGTSLGNVQIWDAGYIKRVRLMEGHSARVGSLAWNSYILSSGSRSGTIIHHDVRERDHLVATLTAHTYEVCGLKWSPDGRFLASGGNDNMAYVWSGIPGQAAFRTRPLFELRGHQAAVKALAWCPWNSTLLASGGGTADRRIRFWNCNSGACVNDIDSKSQVCSLVWSKTYKEIVSGHGFANNQLIIWKYPSLTKVGELTGHTARILHLALSPDGTTVLSAGADETLRMWRCFEPEKKKRLQNKDLKPSVLRPILR